MIRYLVLVAFFAATLAQTIDKTVFKNCSETKYCSRLRNHAIGESSKYSADLGQYKTSEGITSIPLKNKQGNTLNLVISLLEGNKIRVKIQETNSTRFELGDIVIVEDLKILPVKVNQGQSGGLFLIEPTNAEYNYWVSVEAGPPFSVSFFRGDQLIVFLDGDRILMEHSEKGQAFTFKVDFPGSKRLYGLLDHAYNMSLGNTNNGSENTMDPFKLRNSDSWGYEANSPMALYGSRPVIFGHSDNFTSAIFLHNAAEQWIDTKSENTDIPSAYFIVDRAAFDLFVLVGPTPKDIVRQFTALTGTAHLPQIWTLGYHQCRFSYRSQDDVKEVANLLTQTGFPWDAIWIDGDHTDDYRWFHWNRTTYTDPIDMFNNISSLGRVAVTISDPHIAVDDTYDVYIGAKDNYFTKWANGSNYEADCWPGLSSWIDYMIPEASDYYSSWFSYEKFNGSTPTLAGIWNDMNEPAVFDDSVQKTMPFEVLHAGNVPHGDIHNIYGLLQTRATHKGLMDRDNGQKRPFILTRSNFAGSQRYAAMWTGDNSATWDHFANSIAECMTANLMGMVFCGADIGGFIGNPSQELLQRWYQGAVWTPFFRGHSSRESDRREPYLFPESVQEVLKKALHMRYRHIPSFYTLFYEHTVTGDPIISPLYYQYPEVNDRDTQVLLGTDIMGVAVTQEGVSSVPVYFPGKKDVDYWYRIDDGTFDASIAGYEQNVPVNITTSPVYYRAGSIVLTRDTERGSVVEALNDTYSLYVNCDSNNYATARHYQDDYYSFQYYNSYSFYYASLNWNNDAKEVTVRQVDGDSDGIEVKYGQIYVTSLEKTEKGAITRQKVYTHTADGTPLSSIKMNLKAGEEIVIKLK